MLNLLDDRIAALNREIAAYQALIANKQAEIQQLAQLQTQVIEALDTLKEVVVQLKEREPNVLAAIKESAWRILNQKP